MNLTKTDRQTNKILDAVYNPWVIQTGRIFFYLGLFLEIIVFLLDRADWIDPYQSMLFRVTFVFFTIKCLCTRYDHRQIIFIVLTALFSAVTYKLSGKDEAVRCMVFIIAMKDMDLKRTLRFDYIFSSIGIGILGLLSIFGVLGSVLSTPGYGDKADAFMLSMGLGSSNTWAIQIWVLAALAVYLYHDRISKWTYPVMFVFGIVLYAVSRTSTALIMMSFTAVACFVIEFFPKLKKSRFLCLFSIAVTTFCFGFSVFAAKISRWWDEQPEWQRKLDTILTGRITCVYAFENGGGVLSNWKLFGDHDFTQSFDMGIIRMFWWYGIIPGILFFAAIIYLIIWQYRNNDYMGIILTVSIMIFSVFEAHFISVFISRSYLLFMFGQMWHHVIKDSSPEKDKKRHIIFFISSLGKGGAERVFCNLGEYFVSAGYRVTFVTQYKKENEYDLPEGCDRIISDIDDALNHGRIRNFFWRFFKLHHIFVRTDADLILTTIGKNNFMAITACAFIPTRVVVSIVADPKEEYNTGYMRWLMYLLFPEADGIVMQTTQSLEFMKGGLDRKCIILPNSVSEKFICDRYTGERKKAIYQVGRMDSNKNHIMTIKAFEALIPKFPEFKLYLVGGGELKDELEKYVTDHGLSDHIIFTGVISDVQTRLRDAYAFVLTSYTEGMPNTLLEAMALGDAVISTDCPCGGPHDLITNGKDGILIPVGDTEALETSLEELMSDPELTERLGACAYETMIKYRPDTVNKKWQSYFEGIMGI